MEVTDDEGAINLLIGIKYTVIVADTGFHIINMQNYTSLVLCETKVPIKYRGGHTQLSLTKQDIFMYINLFYTAVFGGLNPTPKYV